MYLPPRLPGSEGFEQFLSLLGDRVELRDWPKFRGGLDTRADMTGRHRWIDTYYITAINIFNGISAITIRSVHTTHEEHQLMFHVSTLLPFSHEDKQQVDTHTMILYFMCIDSVLGSVLQIYLSLTQNHFRLH